MAIIKENHEIHHYDFKHMLIRVILQEISQRKVLVIGLKKSGGRNTYGRITIRHRGGGAARKYRIVDFKRTRA